LELLLEHYDHIFLAILDCHMPKMNGPDVCAAVRQHEKRNSLPHIPIIILSGNNNEEFVIECMMK
jgi:CheY-like chemotaxis protein